MKVHRAAFFLCLSGVCFLVDYPAYSSPLKSDNEQMELYLEKLQANIIEEEKAVESLKKRHEDILKKKQNSKEQEVKKENKELDAQQSEKIATETKLKDLESTQHSLRQNNQELLNSLEQSIASIQNKNKTIEELKKVRLAPPREEVLGRQASLKGDYSKEEVATRKQLNALREEKVSLEGQLRALKEERLGRSARDTVQAEPRPAKKGLPADKAGNEKQKEEIKENSFSGKSIDSKGLGNNRTSCFDLSRENKPGILKGFLGKAKKLDSWWREKVW
ncbi:MAG: hypothetical protein Q7J72_07115 [Candidatus Omnitrophota bacterium]|nr:hypothetical protein [Candidatus Omnitrophota bacterium]